MNLLRLNVNDPSEEFSHPVVAALWAACPDSHSDAATIFSSTRQALPLRALARDQLSDAIGALVGAI